MQTFLPHKSFRQSVQVLDNRRLQKQIVEAKQIYDAITDKRNGWRHHPAVQMWLGYPSALIMYGCSAYQEWQRRLKAGRRGGKLSHKSGEQLADIYLMLDLREQFMSYPSWLGDEAFHRSHRRALLWKGYCDEVYNRIRMVTKSRPKQWLEHNDLPPKWKWNVVTVNDVCDRIGETPRLSETHYGKMGWSEEPFTPTEPSLPYVWPA
jgi:hypothetical protein